MTRAILAEVASLSVLAFAISSMLSVGLAYRVRRILRPLRDVHAVFRALVANFVLVPLLAIAIERILPLQAPIALGLFLLAASAGAPFLIKLASAARSDIAASAALLLLLVPATVVFLPLYLPLAARHPSLQGLSYVPSSRFALGLPLLSTMILPMLVGFAGRAVAPRLAGRIAPIAGKVGTIALVLVVLATFLAYFPEVVRVVESGAILAPLLLVPGAFVSGFLISRKERSVVLGLGTGQRNIAGAMVVAAQDFGDREILVMVTVCSLVGILVLFPIAWLLSRRAPHVGPPTPERR